MELILYVCLNWDIQIFMWKNNIPFARFLKQLLKNCQRIRSKRELEKPQNALYAYKLETERIIRFYLYDKLLPLGLIGGEYHIRLLIKHAKVIKKLGKAAKKQKKVLFLKVAYVTNRHWKWRYSKEPYHKFDWRTVPFTEFDVEEYECTRYILQARFDYVWNPF